MLRISVIESPAAQTMVLEGKLTEPYISELELAWKKARQANGSRKLVIDLRNATFIDYHGECALLHMKREGAQFIACGISTTHQLEQLGIACTGRTCRDH
jgi:anti-anti-sigma regulatory factor